MMNNGAQRPDRSKKNGYRHSRNPSIRTLMKSKRFESAAPKHNMIKDIIFSPHAAVDDIGDIDLEMITKTTPKITRLESVINRLRIENSHVMSKAETLQTKTALLHKTLKHSKQQYAILESQTKKLKNQNKYLQQQVASLQHKPHDNDDINADDNGHKISIDSLQKQLQNLQDVHKKSTAKNKKIKKSLEEVINDPALPFHLRTKLLSILPKFYTQAELTSPSSLTEQMKLEFIESDREITPEESPIPLPSPKMHETQTTEKRSKKLMHYKKRKVAHSRNLSESMSTRAYHIRPLSPSFKLGHQRSVSISNTSVACNIDSILSKTRRISMSNEDTLQPLDDLLDDILRNDLEDLVMSDEENNNDEETKQAQPTKKPIKIPKSVPKPPRNRKGRKGSMRRKKPPPPPRPAHAKKSQSEHLNQISTVIKKIKPQSHLNLDHIHDALPSSFTNVTNRIRSASENVYSPSSNEDKEKSRSPPKFISIPLETPLAVSTDDDDNDVNYKNNLKNIQKRGRRRTKEQKATDKKVYRNKAHTEWNPHMRSRSHQPFREEQDSENKINSKQYMPPTAATPTRTRSKLFHIDLGWSLGSKKKKKEKKERKESFKLTKKEENNLTTRRSLLRPNYKKKKKSEEEDGLKLSETSPAEHADDDMSDAVMNFNPLSPVSSDHIVDIERFPRAAYKYSHNGLLSSPELIASSPSTEAVPFLHIHPVLKMSVSTPNSPMTKSLTQAVNKKKERKQSNDDNDIKAPVLSRKSVVKSTHTPTHITRMDQIRMAKLQKKQNNTRQKRFYSAAQRINVSNINTIKPSDEQSKDSPVPGYHLVRRNSFSLKRRQKTDGAFDFWTDKTAAAETKPRAQTRHNPKRTQKKKSNHTRSVSLRGLKKWSPRSRKSSKVQKENNSPRKKMAPFTFGRRGSQDSEGSADSLDDVNKVWTLKDLIREMVSNNYDDTNRMRNALILCHSTFTSSVALFQELRRFFRMSITVMTSTVLYFEDEDDEAYVSPEDRRWQMRQSITHCVIYWISEFWTQDFAKNRELQKEVELFKSDIRTNLHDINRSKQLIEPLMEILTIIKNRYGGINPKNLNMRIPVPTKREDDSPLFEEEDGEKTDSDSATEDEPEYEGSIVIHDDVSDEEEADDDEKSAGSGGKTEMEQKKEMEQLGDRIRSVSARYPALIQLDIAVPHGFNIMELDPEDVAVQLTLLDSFVFKKINSRECIEQNWKKKDKAIRAPNVLKMIAQFNDVSKWVQMTILKGETPRLRKRYIKKVISMATHFMNHGNLSSLCASYNALTSTNIIGLHATWKLLSKSKRKELQEIKALFGWKMSKFKEMQEELQPPCVPHIGIILQTLFQIDEGKRNKNPINGSVNYIKMMMMHQQIDNMQVLQSLNYGDEANFLIQKLLIREFELQSNITETALYKLAKQVANAEKNGKK